MCTPTVEEHSEAGNTNSDGISATESALCEMSRQVSNTESTENPCEQPSIMVLDELVRVSNPELEGMSETLSEISEDTLGRSNSDSTEHAQSEGESSEQSANSQEKVDVKDNTKASDKNTAASDMEVSQPVFIQPNETSENICDIRLKQEQLPLSLERPIVPKNTEKFDHVHICSEANSSKCDTHQSSDVNPCVNEEKQGKLSSSDSDLDLKQERAGSLDIATSDTNVS